MPLALEEDGVPDRGILPPQDQPGDAPAGDVRLDRQTAQLGKGVVGVTLRDRGEVAPRLDLGEDRLGLRLRRGTSGGGRLLRLRVVGSVDADAAEEAQLRQRCLLGPLGGDDSRVGGSSRRDTLCYATQVNQDALSRALAGPLDAAFVIGGKNSSNTYQLFRLCEQKLGEKLPGMTESAALALQLLDAGVVKGAKVAFCFPSDSRFVITWLAVTRIGAVAIPISTLLRSNELVRVIRQSDVSGLLIQRKLLGHDYVDRLCEALPELREATGPELRVARVPFSAHGLRSCRYRLGARTFS